MDKLLNVKFSNLEEMVLSLFVKPLIVVFIYFSMFHRYEIELLGISGGALSVMLGCTLFLISSVFILSNQKMSISDNLVVGLLFFACSFMLPMFSILLLNIEPSLGIRFSMEVLIGFFMFFSFYYLLESGKITPKFIIHVIALTGLFAAIVIIVSFFDPAATIRRLGALGGRNYIANSFAISSVAWIYILYQYVSDKKLYKSISAAVVIIMMLLILLLLGSRQALLAFFLCAVIFNFVILSKLYSLINATVFVGMAVIVLFIIASILDLTALFSRFEISTLVDAMELRLQTYGNAFSGLSSADIILGRPDYYEVWATENAVHPHNFFISLIRYVGVSALVTYLMLLAVIIISYINFDKLFRISKQVKVETLSIYLLFLIPFIYSMLSGNLTRIYSLFIFMGCLLAIIDSKSRNLKNYFYLAKKILYVKS